MGTAVLFPYGNGAVPYGNGVAVLYGSGIVLRGSGDVVGPARPWERLGERSRGGRMGFAEQMELKGSNRARSAPLGTEGEPCWGVCTGLCWGLSANPLLAPTRHCRLQFIPIYLLVEAGSPLLGATLPQGSKCGTPPPPPGATRPAPIPLHPMVCAVSTSAAPVLPKPIAADTTDGQLTEPLLLVPCCITHLVGPQPYKQCSHGQAHGMAAHREMGCAWFCFATW